MNSTTKKIILTLLLLGLLIVLLYGIVTKLVATNTQSVKTELESRYEMQSDRLIQIADATKQNTADDSVALIIKDCSADKRKQFDTLLDKLSTNITNVELSELTGLFYQCGNFYAQQRASMSLVLNREVEALGDTVSLLKLIESDSSTRQADVKTWQDIATAETKVAVYFTQLVELQGSIITALGNGKNADSIEVSEALTEVSKVRGQMVVLSKQIEDYRTTLQSI